ncbi:ATP-binding protein [Rhodoferax sp.]|uniref:ATP-binding protein n=1 Tax=Rhodoferax sp. TaxID=50421 RepID=UPI002638F6AE|nr:ATP-binding protein [Rhodoferax sp.]MDD2809355.1 ATP-binding protein [Rhodoferax sp.]
MDGSQVQIGQSLQARLAVWMTGVISGFALIAGLISFGSSYQEANDLQDDQLLQIALLSSNHFLNPPTQDVDAKANLNDPDSRVILQFLPPAGNAKSVSDGVSSEPVLKLPNGLPEGIQTLTVNNETWRIMVKTLDNGARVVVGQKTAVRDEIARDSALRTLLPFIVLIPILLLLVSALIRRMFKPVKQLALDLDQRDPQDLREVADDHVPSEIHPFVIAINRLLSRVAQSMAVQRRFLADAAHELRSPLTALSLQAERLASSDLSIQARQRLDALQSGLQRSRQLLDQLLALARAQESVNDQAATVSVRRIAHQVMEDLMPIAQAKNIDLGMVGEKDAELRVSEIDLKTLIKNLLDNAIHYTPTDGKIDLHIKSFMSKTILQIEDTGPGIPEEERERVFDPFYRILGNDEVGSGLGLSIVKTIADRIGAVITLGYVRGEAKTGLSVSVEFPAQCSPTTAP